MLIADFAVSLPQCLAMSERPSVRSLPVCEAILREHVSSTMIAAIGYEEETETLEVEFVSGSVCRYLCVSLDLFADFRAAPSKGTFFNRCVRDAYPWERVE